jgi:SPP1 gp7 family putative phage head morphogenesis protein
MNPYSYADREVAKLNRYFIQEFLGFSAIRIDELNVLRNTKAMYARMDDKARRAFVRIARNQKDDITPLVALALLAEYDPVTKYVYEHEVDRKRMRFAEAYIASNGNPAEAKTALRLWSNMIRQYSISVTDEALLLSYKKAGVEYVKWITEEDERRCAECAARHNKIYPIDRIPPKPHINCRCYFVPCESDAID